MKRKSSFFYLWEKIKKGLDKLSEIYRAPYFKGALILYAIIMLPMVYMSVRRNKAEDFYEDMELEDMMPMVKVLKTSRGDFSDTLSVIGTVKGASEVKLKFEISGRLHSFNFREGQNVSEGEVIASLDPDDVMAKLEHARAKRASVSSQYESAREQYEVHKDLYDMGAIIRSRLRESELKVQSLEAEVQRAAAEVRMVRSQLDKTVITAPTEGIMGARFAEEGDFVTPQNEVGTFIEAENVFVEAGIIEREIPKIHEGQKVKITFDAYPGKVFRGVVDNVSRMVRGETRTLPIEIKIHNPDRQLYSGMLASCQIILSHLEDVIMVPYDSIIELGEMEVVPLVKMESDNLGEVELREIQIGYMRSDVAEIAEGLDPGDLIVQETQQPLSDGLKVKVIDIEEFSGY